MSKFSRIFVKINQIHMYIRSKSNLMLGFRLDSKNLIFKQFLVTLNFLLRLVKQIVQFDQFVYSLNHYSCFVKKNFCGFFFRWNRLEKLLFAIHAPFDVCMCWRGDSRFTYNRVSMTERSHRLVHYVNEQLQTEFVYVCACVCVWMHTLYTWAAF